MTEFSIYVLGDADSYFHILNSIAAIMQEDYITIVTSMAMMILMIRAGVNFSKANINSGTGALILGITVFAAALYPSTTAHIIDVRKHAATKTYAKIDNLPFALTFLGYTASGVTVALISIFDSAFSVAGTNNASSIGVGREPELIKDILMLSNLDSQQEGYKRTYYKTAFKIYTNECAMAESYMPSAGLDYFENSYRSIFEHISPDELGIPASASTTTSFHEPSLASPINSCRELFTYIEDKRAEVENILYDKLKKANPDINWDSYEDSIAEGIYKAGFRVEEFGVNISDYSNLMKASMINYALSGAMKESIDNYKFDVQGVSDLATFNTNKNMVQMMSDGVATVAWVNKIAPLVIQYILLFSYGLFLLMVPVALGMGFENSIKMFSNYGMGIIAIHIGYVAAVIANSISLFYNSEGATDKILSIGNNLTSVTAIPEYHLFASEMQAISGVLIILAYTAGSAVIFKGETAALNGAISNIAGRFRNQMSEIGNDIASKQAYDAVDAKQKKEAEQFLKDNGFTSLPEGVGLVEYHNQLQRSLNEMSAGQGFMDARKSPMNENFDGNYLDGGANKSAQVASSISEYGGKANTEEAIKSGIVMGNQNAGNTTGMATALDQHGADTIQDTAHTSSLAKLKDSIAQMGVLNKKFGRDLDGTTKGMTYGEMAGYEADQKLGGRVGNAKGYKETDDAFDKTVENAEFGTKQKLATTQANIKGKGGVDEAVAIDEKSAEIRAGKEKGTTERQVKELEKAIENGVANGAKSLADAMAAVSDVTTASQMGKEIGLAKKLHEANAEELKSDLLNATDANGNKMFTEDDLKDMYDSKGNLKTGGELASWIAEKQAGHMQSMHALSIDGKSVGLSLGNDNVRVASIDSGQTVNTGTKKDDVDSNAIGTRNDTYDQDNLHVTKTEDRIAQGRSEDPLEYKRNFDAAKFGTDPRNLAAVAGAELAQLTDSGEAGSLVAAGLTVGGVSAIAANKLTKAPVQFSEKGLEKLNAITNEDGDITGYEDLDGNRVADKDGYALDKNGRKIQSGTITRGFKGLVNAGSDFLESFTSNESVQESTNEKNSNNNSSPKSNSQHGNSLVKYTDSLSEINTDVNKEFDLTSKSNSFSSKAGLFGFAAATAHSLASNGWDIGQTMDGMANEVSQTWNQFRSDLSNKGFVTSATNQIADALMGEENRVQARTMDARGDNVGAFTIAATGTAQNIMQLGADVANMATSTVQSSVSPHTTYAQAFAQNQQSWANVSFADTVGTSSISGPTADALSGTNTVDNPTFAKLDASNTTQEEIADANVKASGAIASAIEEGNDKTQELIELMKEQQSSRID